MFEKKQMLPIGSKVTVRYALDGGTETVLVIVGHLSLRKKFESHYDYVCVLYPNGIEDGIRYINHTDIVSVIYDADKTDKAYIKWCDKKFIEYKVYYENYDPKKRINIDAMRESIVDWQNKAEDTKERKHIKKAVVAAIIIFGAGVTVLLSGNWWGGLCAFCLATAAYLIK